MTMPDKNQPAHDGCCPKCGSAQGVIFGASGGVLSCAKCASEAAKADERERLKAQKQAAKERTDRWTKRRDFWKRFEEGARYAGAIGGIAEIARGVAEVAHIHDIDRNENPVSKKKRPYPDWFYEDEGPEPRLTLDVARRILTTAGREPYERDEGDFYEYWGLRGGIPYGNELWDLSPNQPEVDSYHIGMFRFKIGLLSRSELSGAIRDEIDGRIFRICHAVYELSEYLMGCEDINDPAALEDQEHHAKAWLPYAQKLSERIPLPIDPPWNATELRVLRRRAAYCSEVAARFAGLKPIVDVILARIPGTAQTNDQAAIL